MIVRTGNELILIHDRGDESLVAVFERQEDGLWLGTHSMTDPDTADAVAWQALREQV